MKASEILKKESSWTKNAHARDKNGKSVRPLSKEAVCWCIRGAVVKSTGGDMEKRLATFEKIKGALDRDMKIDVWNDLESTTHKMVLELLEAAGV